MQVTYFIQKMNVAADINKTCNYYYDIYYFRIFRLKIIPKYIKNFDTIVNIKITPYLKLLRINFILMVIFILNIL